MSELHVFCWEMALISETYLSTLSALMKPHGLERFFVPLLELNKRSGEITQKELAEILKRDKVTVMRMVDYFSERDLVVRKQSSNDRRCQFLEMTPKGIALIPLIKEAIKKTDEILLVDFSGEEKQSFRKAMDKFMSRISDLPQSDFIIHATKRKK